MSTRLAVGFLAALVLAGGIPAHAKPRPTPTPTATPSPPPEDPAITKVVRREFVAWESGNVDLGRYSDAAKAQITPEKIATTSKNLALLGALQKVEYIEPVAFENEPAGTRAFIYKMTCSDGIVFEQIVLDAQSKVTGIVFRDKLPQ
ncbi:MAG: hypothetical protein M3M96_06850 [Candidatus Eremiobacteraeota bacterium]|nr:hypothetical protein [Candidatus Eremiobacteraeota bacterium]